MVKVMVMVVLAVVGVPDVDEAVSQTRHVGDRIV
jgi:hypothetical protein